MIGRRLLHYEIVGHIGAGGMGDVWRARDTRLERDVAIKVLARDATHDTVQKQRFFREARAASALVHPNIITVHEINSADGMDFIVMELVRGGPLSALLALGKLPIPQALSYGMQIAEALAAAHDAGVIHRDLKPGNIMISSSGLVKVVDFGIAKRVTAHPSESQQPASGPLTVAGVALGTPAYMSPEQAVGDPLDARSDVYSFGVVLYQMVTGELPFRGNTNAKVVREKLDPRPLPLRNVADLPPALVRVIEKCLAPDPDDRFNDGSAVLRALGQLSGRLQPPPALVMTQAETAAQPTTSATRRRRAAVAAAIVAAVSVGVAAWVAWPALSRWLGQAGAAPTVSDAGASAGELYRRGTDLLHAYYREGNVDRAIDDLERALRLRSPYPLAEARLSLAYVRKNSQSPDAHWQTQALSHAQSAVRGDPQLAFAHMAEGAALALRGQFDAADVAYRRALTLDPANAEVLWRLGDLAVARKDAKTAEEYYRRSVSAGPKEWEPLMRLGSFLYRQGRYQDALDTYETSRQLAPDNTRVYAALAAVYHQLDRTDEAAAALQRSLEIAPDSITYSNLGTLLYFEGRYAEAVSAFERGVQLGANSYLRWGNLADAQRMVAADRDKAHASYASAIQLTRERLTANAADTEARSSLAVYLIRDGRPKEALAELDTVLTEKGLTPNVLFNCTIVAELAGQRTRALDLLGRALAGGYQLREVIHEPDLVKLRADPEYHRLIARHEK
ncbi:MAG TPA: protein kinase [Vicinamibacterales bacterium]|nr:protein kinase [Vicinamibacterales bacterium]